MMALPVVNMLWVEGALGPVERACMRAALAQGHRVDLWHYLQLSGVPEGVALRDGDEVLPRNRLFRHVPTGSYALFANLFRYHLLQQGRGLWLDADIYLVRPVAWDDGHVFGYEESGVVGNAVLGLPPESPVLDALIEYYDARRVPRWLPLAWRLRYHCQRLLTGRFRIETMPWGYLGPVAVTHMLRKHGLNGRIRPQSVFSPFGWRDADWVFTEGPPLEARIAPDTRAVHLFNQLISDRKNAAPLPGSFMARLHREGR